MSFGVGLNLDRARRQGGLIDPLALPGIIDLWKWNDLTRMWTESTRATAVVSVGDPVGSWGGQRGVGDLATVTSTARAEYQTDGVLFNSTSATKNLFHTLAQAATAPFSVCVRSVNNSPLTSAIVGAGFGTSGAASYQHAIWNDITTGVQAAYCRNGLTVGTAAGQGDVCAVLSFNGTAAFLIENNGTMTTVAVSTGGTSVSYLRARAALGGLAVSSIKYLQAHTAALTETQARDWITWARAQS